MGLEPGGEISLLTAMAMEASIAKDATSLLIHQLRQDVDPGGGGTFLDRRQRAANALRASHSVWLEASMPLGYLFCPRSLTNRSFHCIPQR
jgi:hypothetical protein